jgi:hypothetical protein
VGRRSSQGRAVGITGSHVRNWHDSAQTDFNKNRQLSEAKRTKEAGTSAAKPPYRGHALIVSSARIGPWSNLSHLRFPSIELTVAYA